MKDSDFFMKKIAIKTDFITLGQFLKFADIVSSGGMTKMLLEESKIHVNDLVEDRRGKKCYPGDKISVEGYGIYRVVKNED
jgi:S4 domain protein YaaA